MKSKHINDLSSSPTLEEYRNILMEQLQWIASLQTTCGALVNSPQYAKLNPNLHKATPYFANIAASALTCDAERLKSVKKYIQWYLSHLNRPDKKKINGEELNNTIYDYFISPSGDEYSSYDYDSADSYPATFISLLRSYCERGGETDFLQSQKDTLDSIGTVMFRLMDKDSLTWAKPDYKVKYLMDNCEVYKGLKDAEFLFARVFHDTDTAGKYRLGAFKVKHAIMTILKKNKEFCYAKSRILCAKKPNWHKWYPDATSQLYPILFEVISPEDPLAVYLFQNFNEKWDWSSLKNNDRYPWVLVGYTAAVMGYRVQVEGFYKNLVEKFIKQPHSPYWYSFEAGWFVFMVDRVIKNGWYQI